MNRNNMNRNSTDRSAIKKMLTMRQWIFRSILAAILCCPAQARTQGYLKTSGHIIVNEKGEKMILRGMGLGGWMLQEGYMFRLGNIGQQHLIKAKISELIGSSA